MPRCRLIAGRGFLFVRFCKLRLATLPDDGKISFADFVGVGTNPLNAPVPAYCRQVFLFVLFCKLRLATLPNKKPLAIARGIQGVVGMTTQSSNYLHEDMEAILMFQHVHSPINNQGGVSITLKAKRSPSKNVNPTIKSERSNSLGKKLTEKEKIKSK